MSEFHLNCEFKSRYHLLLCFLLMQNADESLLTERGPLSMEKAKFMAFLFDRILEKGPMKTRGAENQFKLDAIEKGITRNENVFNAVRKQLTYKNWIHESVSEEGRTLRLNVSDDILIAIRKIASVSVVKFCLYYEAETDKEKKN